MALSGNIGEWSEVYTLFKLLGDGILYAGNEDLEKIDNLYYPIVSVIRREGVKGDRKDVEYKNDKPLVVIYENNIESNSVQADRFSEIARKLLFHIKEKCKNSAPFKATFTLPDIEDFMESVKCRSLKASTIDKSDIHIVIHDMHTGMTPCLGFSIKSKLGSLPTLLNPSSATNIVYEVLGPISKNEIESINSIKKQGDRMRALFSQGCWLRFWDMDDRRFRDNLIIIDSLLPTILSEVIKEHFLSNVSDLKDITTALIKRNPLSMDNPEIYYPIRIKELLIDSALGMTPTKPWKRQYDANGGYLVVRKDGEIVCYHFYEKNQTENYLFNNTKIDFPGRSRHKYGDLFESDGKIFIKLNFQIRFK